MGLWLLSVLLICCVHRSQQLLYWSYTTGVRYQDAIHLCLTACNYHGRDYKWCWFAWNKYDHCEPETSLLQSNFTSSAEGKECVSSCAKHGGTRYSWCYTSIVDNEWDHCKENKVRLSLTSQGKLCMTDCVPYGDGKHYCYISWKYWEDCNPGDLTIEAPKTSDDGKCTSLCGTYGYDYNWCYEAGVDTTFTARCPVNSIDYLNSLCPGDANIAPGQISTCIKSVIADGRDDIPVHYNNSKQLIEKLNALRQIISDHGLVELNNSSGPVTSYAVNRDNRGQFVNYVRAKIGQSYVGKWPQSSFSRVEEARMRELGAKSNDRKGHLLAHFFGGNRELWNLVPKSTGFLSGSPWSSKEAQLLQRVEQFNNSEYIEWELFIRYGSGRRPVHYTLHTTEIDLNGNKTFESVEIYTDYSTD